MRLPRPFYQLPVLFDADRLLAEVAALPAAAWVAHPDDVAGNSAVRLISAGGGENDAHVGTMLPTPWLQDLPYVRQILAGFGVVWSRSRLMRLAPGVGVPEHADINYHWHARVRLHIPVQTTPEVLFHCDGESVHMAAGQAWVFDNWRSHRVDNESAFQRIHLVADTSGTAEFWRFACGPKPPVGQWPRVVFQPDTMASVMTEADQRTPVMPAAEAQWLIEDLLAEIVDLGEKIGDASDGKLDRFGALLQDFLYDWRQLCALHGIAGRGRSDFHLRVDALRTAAAFCGEGLIVESNGVDALLVLEKRVLQHLVPADLMLQPSG